MAILLAQQIIPGGLVPALSPASPGGDQFTPGDATFLYVQNADTAAHTVTVTPQISAFGLALENLVVVVAPGPAVLIGPFPAQAFKAPDGYAQVAYSAVTLLSLASVFIQG